MKICSFDDCDRKHWAKGFCHNHYRQWIKNGELKPIRIVRGKNAICEFEGCGKPHSSHGLCSGHRDQQKLGKELSPLKVSRRPGEAAAEIARGVLTCRKCERLLPLDRFTRGNGPQGVHSYCKECDNDWHIFKRYGLSREAWQELLDQQNGCCAICGTDEPGGKGTFVVDHDHGCCPGRETCGNCVRSLLCNKCNHTVGFIETHPDIMAAMEYVQNNHVQLPEKYFESAAQHYGWLRVVGE